MPKKVVSLREGQKLAAQLTSFLIPDPRCGVPFFVVGEGTAGLKPGIAPTRADRDLARKGALAMATFRAEAKCKKRSLCSVTKLLDAVYGEEKFSPRKIEVRVVAVFACVAPKKQPSKGDGEGPTKKKASAQ